MQNYIILKLNRPHRAVFYLWITNYTAGVKGGKIRLVLTLI